MTKPTGDGPNFCASSAEHICKTAEQTGTVPLSEAAAPAAGFYSARFHPRNGLGYREPPAERLS